MNRDTRQIRTIMSGLETRADEEGPIIEGYFAVFNSVYQMWSECSESIAPGAFADTISGDIRALINHDTNLVIGRTTARTLELKEDQRGLWGKIRINEKDTDAMNIHARVERGDVSQCSIGFSIIEEEHEVRKDGTHHFTIKKAKLFEVSCCTFPAYEETAISARKKDIADYEKRALDVWKKDAARRLKEVMGNA